ncbi:hypothetical protein Pint_10276 [Pistacia integerrima]|uniref:Uncharacterized protein n=2 Tax=Pistacia TaxID=55512 RepID=A0ACC1A3R8_9ROSI|nr:hypothetical protein Pint_10276 [Pistacia integerrima]KAJ0081081.1 hypothetical protein Patl1_10377 [Pistacia atlantica]
MGARLMNTTEDPCQSLKIPLATSLSTLQVNLIACNRTIGNFSHITNIRLKYLSLPGTIPTELVNLRFLEEIDLSCNYLNGTLPEKWAYMQHLNKIGLTSNRLTGEIPTEWGSFNNLSGLCLDENRLHGTIPKELGYLVQLTTLILSGNRFSGNFPRSLGNLKNLSDFRISDNNFAGTIPEFIGGWTCLQRLEMHSSGLEGPIPHSLFGLGNLSDLRISDMNGPKFKFPNLSNKNIKYVVLRNLNMSGSIPTEIWEMSNLHVLDLTFNKLEGKISSTEVHPNFIFLSDNMLTGDIPDSFRTSQGSYMYVPKLRAWIP